MLEGFQKAISGFSSKTTLLFISQICLCWVFLHQQLYLWFFSRNTDTSQIPQQKQTFSTFEFLETHYAEGERRRRRNKNKWGYFDKLDVYCGPWAAVGVKRIFKGTLTVFGLFEEHLEQQTYSFTFQRNFSYRHAVQKTLK